MYRNYLKRLLDFLAALVLVLFFLPVMLLVAVLLYLFQQRQVFFRQQRPGLNQVPFTLLKFRTMTDARDTSGNLLPDARRLTKIGQFVRRWSLDELPQLFNVLKGDMSLVGPRPLLMDYLAIYTQKQGFRHSVRPGITGWAQVNGRNATTWQARLTHDVWYAHNLSFSLDVKIIVRTILLVLTGQGINSEGKTPMPRFTGAPD